MIQPRMSFVGICLRAKSTKTRIETSISTLIVVVFTASLRAKSTKTRIETSYEFQNNQFLPNGLRAKSTKTRIETQIRGSK